jgi:hypothetical protein
MLERVAHFFRRRTDQFPCAINQHGNPHIDHLGRHFNFISGRASLSRVNG